MARILVIDDDEAVRESLGLILNAVGHETIVAASGDEGIAQCRAKEFDLAVIDIFMPEKNGLETIIELHKEFPELSIIAISGGHLTSSAMLSSALKLGAVQILEKPFEMPVFLKTINETLFPAD